MGISLRVEHLKRYKEISSLLWRYGRSDLVRHAGLDGILTGEDGAAPSVEGGHPDRLASDLEKMGPTFVKLGQLLSTRADLLPLAYMDALARLQDDVEPFAFVEVETIVQTELGTRLSKAFLDFDPVPVAAASLGQIHRARLRDGRLVAVKVQRPGIREEMAKDLDALEEIAEFLDHHTEFGRRYELQRLLVEFRRSLVRELDYRLEASNLVTLATHLREFDRIVVPRPVEDYTTSRVLTMDYIQGRKITALGPMARLEIDGAVLAEQLFRAYLQQILVDGFFHADPHPGNVFLAEDGRLALLDLGLVARIAPGLSDKLLQLLLALSEGRSDDAATQAIAIGEARDGFDEAEVRRRTAEIAAHAREASIERLEVGKIVLAIARATGECGLRMPSELTLLGKTLLNLDYIGRILCPQFDPNAAIRRNSAEILRRRLIQDLTPGHLITGLLETRDFLARLPGRFNQILEALATNKLKLTVDALEEQVLVEGFQKVANRIAMGLVLAALIVGAALLMRVETDFRVFGYPGLAMIAFLAAASGGVALMLSILLHDRPARK